VEESSPHFTSLPVAALYPHTDQPPLVLHPGFFLLRFGFENTSLPYSRAHHPYASGAIGSYVLLSPLFFVRSLFSLFFRADVSRESSGSPLFGNPPFLDSFFRLSDA